MKIDELNFAIGRRIRFWRYHAKISQEALGEALGVTYQQIQKYEQGINKIGAAQLRLIAKALSVPVAAFFEDDGASPLEPGAAQFLNEIAGDRDFLSLTRGFSEIRAPGHRRAVLQLIGSLKGEAHGARTSTGRG